MRFARQTRERTTLKGLRPLENPSLSSLFRNNSDYEKAVGSPLSIALIGFVTDTSPRKNFKRFHWIGPLCSRIEIIFHTESF